MDGALATFQGRAKEIEDFLSFVAKVQKLTTKRDGNNLFTGEYLPILKASAFLIIYNLIESSIRSAFGSLYELMDQDGAAFPDVSQPIRKVWLVQQMELVKPESANKDTYIEVFESIAEKIVSRRLLQLNARSLPISGNLDADSVRKLCKKHGIELSIPAAAKGGHELNTVKLQRNALSHGFKSFVECGREYDVSDLWRIYRQSRHFLLGFLRSVDRYYRNNSHQLQKS